MAARGHNFQWNPVQTSNEEVGSVDTGKLLSGGLGRNQDGVKTNDLAHAFNGIVRSEALWKQMLGKPPKWLIGSRCVKGRRGGSNREALWNPILFGVSVKDKHKIPIHAVRSRFRGNAALKPWLEQWREVEATYYPDE